MTYTTDAEYDDERAGAALRAIAGKCPDLAAEATRALLVSGAPRQMRLDRLIPAALETGALDADDRSLLVSLVGIGRVSDGSPGERRTSVVQVRLTPAERSELDAAAGAAGLSVSELIRSTMFGSGQGEAMSVDPMGLERRAICGNAFSHEADEAATDRWRAAGRSGFVCVACSDEVPEG